MQDLTDRDLLTRIERAAAARDAEEQTKAEAAREAAEAAQRAAEQARRDDAMRTVEGALADARQAAAALMACAEEWRRQVDVLRQAKSTIRTTLFPFATWHQRETLSCLGPLVETDQLNAAIHDSRDPTLTTIIEHRATRLTNLAARVLEPPEPEPAEVI